MITTTKLKPLLNDRKATFRLAMILLAICGAFFAGKFWEGVQVESLRNDCGSLFRDRLLPSAMLFHLNDQVHERREVLETYLSGEQSNGDGSIEERLSEHDANIMVAVKEIAQTYLVEEEAAHLHKLHGMFADYSRLEGDLLRRHHDGENVVYEKELKAAYTRIRSQLLGLIKVQEHVGHKLNQDSVVSAAHVSSLLHFQLGITLILGLIASALALSLTLPTSQQNGSRRSHLH